jgi:dTDP-4-dehydrorhamnose reductase
MKILLLGANGQLGHELKRTLCALGEVVPVTKAILDLTELNKIQPFILKYEPHVIVNAAAYTNVDKAEKENNLIANKVNHLAVEKIANVAGLCDSALVHYSTDYVFDGKKNKPYLEYDKTGPLNVYGKTKLDGENKIISDCTSTYAIFRTSWVYGLYRENFLTKILHLLSTKETIHIVDDQIGAPTWSRCIAEATAQYIASEKIFKHEYNGIINMTCTGQTSWYEFAKEILGHSGLLCNILPIKTETHSTPAKRPKYSVLDTTQLKYYGFELPHWKQALRLVMGR